MTEKSTIPNPHQKKKPKKTYKAPKFEVFGTLGDITQNVGKYGGPDGSTAKNKYKTYAP